MNQYINQPPRQLSGLALIAYKKTLKLTNEQKDVLIGTLLGDASIACKKGKPVCVKFEQKATREKYIYHLFTILAPYVGTPPRLRTFENDFHKTKPGQSVWFRTYAHESLLFYENLFYIRDLDKKRVKRVPKNIHKLLTPRALAYWFMDDGSTAWYKQTGYIQNYMLHTEGFTYDDQKILVCALKSLYQLNINITRDGKYYKLYICVDSRNRFRNLIKSYMHEDFLYKLKAKSI